MSRGRISLLLLLGTICLAGCRQEEAAEAPVSLSALPPGQQIFLSHCVACHTGAGNPPGANAVVLDSERLKTEAVFRALVRQPVSPAMRAFGPEELSDAEVHQLYIYLQSAKTPKAP